MIDDQLNKTLGISVSNDHDTLSNLEAWKLIGGGPRQLACQLVPDTSCTWCNSARTSILDGRNHV